MTPSWPLAWRSEVRDLERQVDELAEDRDELVERLALQNGHVKGLRAQLDDVRAERDELADRLARSEQSQGDVRQMCAQLKQAAREAFEPARTGCTKLRYLHRDDAETHAIHLLAKTGGLDYLNAYPCTACAPHPGYGTPWWHVGHCRSYDAGSIQVQGRTAHYGCGCIWAIHSGAFSRRCPSHAETVAEAS